jgi:hypothetical protein
VRLAHEACADDANADFFHLDNPLGWMLIAPLRVQANMSFDLFVPPERAPYQTQIEQNF